MRHILFWEVAWCSLQPVDDVSRHLSVTCSRVNSARRIHSLTVWRLVPTTILHHVTSQKSEGLNYSAAELLHYHVTQCYTMLHYHVTQCYTIMLHNVTQCYTIMLHNVTLSCYTMLHYHVTQCYTIMLHNVTLCYTRTEACELVIGDW